MMQRVFIGFISLAFLLLYTSSCKQTDNSDQVDSGNNVILLMLDGVRWQEFYHGTDTTLDQGKSEKVIFSNLFHSTRPSFFIGDRNSQSEMTVSNPYIISLPAYESIMAGFNQDCDSNSCKRVEAETFQERLVNEFHIPKMQIATLASWDKIAFAVESKEGQTFVNAGNMPVSDGSNDAEFDAINQKQEANLSPWSSVRRDEYTFAHGLHYLKKYQPRFLYISLDESDEWAHKGSYEDYVKILKQYDEWIKTLFDTLDTMGDYGKTTTVLITTDHGRGDGTQWTSHHAGLPEAKYIWFYGSNPKMKPASPSLKTYSHSDIRPTIEALMGLKPFECKSCGGPISELLTLSK